MDTDRRHQVTELVKTLRELPADERPTQLERACAGDADLRREVEALLETAGPSERPPDTIGPRPAERPPSQIGKYKIVGKIGKGGFGEVFLGRDPVIKRQVAVKLCNSGDERLRRRFSREVEIAGGLQHPNITTVHDSGTFGEIPYLVQEYLPGEDLAQQIRSRRETTPAERLRYLIQVARGLSYAHGRGVVHRDVKPSNVRVLEDGTVKILDFGIARLLDDAKTRLTQTGMRIGTMCYMAPEQLRGEKVDPRADIFSFGILAYELLSYEHPFKAESGHQVMYRVLESEPTPLEELWSDCPPRLADCVRRCLAKDADQRFDDMVEVLNELEAVAVEESAMATAVTSATSMTSVRAAALPGRRGPRRRRSLPSWARRLAGAAVVLAVLALVYLLGRGAIALEPLTEPPSLKPEAQAAAQEVPASPEPSAPATTSIRPPPEATTSVRPSASPPPPAHGPEGAADPPGAATPRPVPETPLPVKEPEVVAPELRVDAGTEGQAQPPAPGEAAPPAPLAKGRVAINALPWALIESLTAADGTEIELKTHYTPLGLVIPIGVYSLVLSDPGSGGLRRCRLEVRTGSVGGCHERFSRVRAEDFFALYEPDAGSGRRPPHPPPGPPGRPPTRGGRPPDPPRKIPSWLKKSAQAYFDGDYASVEGLLASGKVKEERERFYVFLFRGSALHALYLLGGEDDESLATTAARDLKACREHRSAFSPSSEHFSPRFIEFFSVAGVRAGS